jgi:hypothetical protein
VNNGSQSVASEPIVVTLPVASQPATANTGTESAPLAAIGTNGNGNGNGSSLTVSRLS